MDKFKKDAVKEMETRIKAITTGTDQYIDYGGFDKRKGA